MAAEDDLDDLEAELEGYDDDDDEDAPAWKRLLKKNKLFLIPIVAAPILGLAIWVTVSGSDKNESKMLVVKELAPEPGKPIKMAPDQPGGGTSGEQVFNMVAEGADKGKIAITAPPEDPKKPGAEGGEAAIAMVPEGAEKTPKDAKAADGSMLPPPTAPGKEGDAALPTLPAPTAPADGKTAESILPPADGKQPDKPADVAAVPAQPMQPMQPAPAAPAPAAQPAPAQPVAPPPSNQLTVVIPKSGDQQVVLLAPPPQVAPAPPPTESNVTPMRTMAGVYRVQVASARSESAAKTLWGKQVAKHPDLLGELPLTVQPAVVSDRGTFYRVQGGAFGDRESADSVCRKLKSRGQDCIVVRP